MEPDAPRRLGDDTIVSVIVPTLNEAARIGPLLRALLAERQPAEIIVVDGGSADGTAARAADTGPVRVIRASRGRGAQIAAGLALARGDVVLMLHADSRLRPGALGALVRALAAQPAAVGGNFRLLFDGRGRFDRWLCGFYAWIRRRGLFYGDSGIFARRDVLEAVGGVRPMPIMEDFDLVRRLRAAGPLVCVESPPLVTSSRRFAGRHPAMIVLGWLRLHALHLLGVPAGRLARLYDSERVRGGRS